MLHSLISKIIETNPSIIGYLAPLSVALFLAIVYIVGKFYSQATLSELDRRATLIHGFHESFDVIITPGLLTYLAWNLIPSNFYWGVSSLVVQYVLFLPLEGALIWQEVRNGKSSQWSPHSIANYYSEFFSRENNLTKSLGFESFDHLPSIIFSTANFILLSVSIKSFINNSLTGPLLLLLSIYFFYGLLVVILTNDSYSGIDPSFARVVKENGEHANGIMITKNDQEVQILEPRSSLTKISFLASKNILERSYFLEAKNPYEFYYRIKTQKKLTKKFIRRIIRKPQKDYRIIERDKVEEINLISTENTDNMSLTVLKYIREKYKSLKEFWLNSTLRKQI